MRRLFAALALVSSVAPLYARVPLQSMPLYQSVEDPAGQQPRKVLVDDSVLKFGQAGDDRDSLLRSDLGFSLYFLKIDGENCYGPAKLRMVADWLAKSGFERGHVRFYSDHASDAPVFDWADEPVAVNPHARLARLAISRGWAVEDWG